MSSLSVANADFGLQLLRLGFDCGTNGFLSPMSISVALAMTYAGAEGRTAKQIKEVLFPGVKEKDIHEGMCRIQKMLTQPKPGYDLLVANKIYVIDCCRPLKQFTDTLVKYYDTEIQPVNFGSASVCAEINGWVAKVTKGYIEDLISELDPHTFAVIVNAIYFKGYWKNPFSPDKTENNVTFYSTPEKETAVSMMNLEDVFLYGETPLAQILGMPYEKSDLAMFVFLPKERHGLEQVDCHMTGRYILKLIQETKPMTVFVKMPKFKFETSLDLAKVLTYLGMKDMFLQVANFKKMADLPLFISKVVHKAVIELDEKGTVAVAATASIPVYQSLACEPPPRLEFIADHSFMFALVDNRTKSLLFAGKFYNL